MRFCCGVTKMPKKLKPVQTKLVKQSLVDTPKAKIGILDRKKKNKQFPRAFRLTGEDLQNLKKITKFVNQESKRYVSETKVIQALIYLGLELPPPRIVKAIREFW